MFVKSTLVTWESIKFINALKGFGFKYYRKLDEENFTCTIFLNKKYQKVPEDLKKNIQRTI